MEILYRYYRYKWRRLLTLCKALVSMLRILPWLQIHRLQLIQFDNVKCINITAGVCILEQLWGCRFSRHQRSMGSASFYFVSYMNYCLNQINRCYISLLLYAVKLSNIRWRTVNFWGIWSGGRGGVRWVVNWTQFSMWIWPKQVFSVKRSGEKIIEELWKEKIAVHIHEFVPYTIVIFTSLGWNGMEEKHFMTILGQQ